MLEDYALVRPVYLAKRSNSHNLHCIDRRNVCITATECKAYLIGSTVPFALARKSESAIRKRNAHQQESRIGRRAGKGGGVADECHGTGSSNEADLAV